MQLTTELNTIPDLTTTGVFGDNAVLLVLKVALVLVAVLYAVYGVITVRQVKIMNDTVMTSLGGVIQVLSWLHLALAIGFGLFILILL